MKLSELFDAANCRIVGNAETNVTGLAYDSRNVRPGDIFFCIRGTAVDGNRFAGAAAESGAAAIMSFREHSELELPQVVVEDERSAMAAAAAAFYRHPERRLKIVGITGTNGKTTTTHMIKRIAERTGWKVGLIGTICNMIGEKELPAERTTPESPDLEALIARMADEGCDLVVMEVSSHALFLKRVHGLYFDVGIFSNLTQDHLDFHGSMGAYAQAKQLLFKKSAISVINTDDAYGDMMAQAAAGPVRTYAIDSKADYQATDLLLDETGVSYRLQDGSVITVAIPGRFTVFNSLAAVVTAKALGIPIQTIQEALGSMPAVAGRFEPIDTRGAGFSLILDYAHTPDSLENVLRTARSFARGDVIAVFGCGGNRDTGKRPQMGAIAARLADQILITSDNPRFEDPGTILRDIEVGIPQGVSYEKIVNRRAAMKAALQRARPGDVIVLAGKGHETYQEIEGVKHPFDEKVVIQQLLDELEL